MFAKYCQQIFYQFWKLSLWWNGNGWKVCFDLGKAWQLAAIIISMQAKHIKNPDFPKFRLSFLKKNEAWRRVSFMSTSSRVLINCRKSMRKVEKKFIIQFLLNAQTLKRKIDQMKKNLCSFG